ncbi:MAG: hypothetical protein K5770_06145 [Lachnospiraceae bacterium]|nr:hypothetical protein [Lachnospiraceae bacterium]
MRSSEELLKEVMNRSETVREKRSLKKRIIADGTAGVLCLVLMSAAFFSLPRLAPGAQGAGMQQYGSLLLASPYIGYIVVCLLGFGLGVCVTLLLIHLRWFIKK